MSAARGECDRVGRGGGFFLIAACEVPGAPLDREPVSFVGVDLGIADIADIATTSAGYRPAGAV